MSDMFVYLSSVDFPLDLNEAISRITANQENASRDMNYFSQRGLPQTCRYLPTRLTTQQTCLAQ